ncbi:MAG TPA: ABC transporter ATP-binding protein [Solirubrobacteraceae bacterium]|jgi:iron(III) transport system ATP-binding protein
MSSDSDLWVLDLWKGYASAQPVLRGVNLSVPAGTQVAVLGLSGCGKTTLLRAIAGFERSQRGRIALGTRTLDDGHVYVAPERRGIGYVPQEGALFPNLTVQANVAFGLSRAERRTKIVQELLELVGIEPLARRFPHQLSGGEQQRVALARALARRPEVLLLDEPFSSLDASLRVTVREEVSALLRRQGATTMLVTHDQEEALSLADTVAVLRDGVIVQQGIPAELYSKPVDARLASFLGEANLLEATFEEGAAQTVLGRLQLHPDHTRAPGLTHGVVIVRPEQLQVRAKGESNSPAGTLPGTAESPSPPDKGLPGTVEQCRYYGHDALLHIRPQERPGAALIARVHGEQALAAGTAVLVTAQGPVSAVE